MTEEQLTLKSSLVPRHGFRLANKELGSEAVLHTAMLVGKHRSQLKSGLVSKALEMVRN